MKLCQTRKKSGSKASHATTRTAAPMTSHFASNRPRGVDRAKAAPVSPVTAITSPHARPPRPRGQRVSMTERRPPNHCNHVHGYDARVRDDDHAHDRDGGGHARDGESA